MVLGSEGDPGEEQNELEIQVEELVLYSIHSVFIKHYRAPPMHPILFQAVGIEQKTRRTKTPDPMELTHVVGKIYKDIKKNIRCLQSKKYCKEE